MAKRLTPEIPTITDVSQLPLVCTIGQFCAALGRKYWTVRKDLSNGTCVPAPAFTHPYRWLKSDIERHLQAMSMTGGRFRRGR